MQLLSLYHLLIGDCEMNENWNIFYYFAVGYKYHNVLLINKLIIISRSPRVVKLYLSKDDRIFITWLL